MYMKIFLKFICVSKIGNNLKYKWWSTFTYVNKMPNFMIENTKWHVH